MNRTAALAVMGVLFGGCGGATDQPASSPSSTTEVEAAASATPTASSATAPTATATVNADGKLEMGKAVFEKNCVTCHATGGQGNIGPNLTDAKFIHGSEPKDVLAVVRDGQATKQMPAWGKLLKEQELDAVVAYVVSLSKKP